MSADKHRSNPDLSAFGACRAASAQQELEGSVNGLKKETGAQLRELACDKGEALRALHAAKQAAEQRQQQLQVSPVVARCNCRTGNREIYLESLDIRTLNMGHLTVKTMQ